MPILPEVICSKTGIPVGSDAIELLNFLRDGGGYVLDGLLASELSREAATISLEVFPSYKIRVSKQSGEFQDKYCSVQFEGSPLPVIVGFVSDKPLDAPTTTLENLLFWALLDSDLSWHTEWDKTDQFIDWRKLAKGKAIIAEPTGFGDEGRRMLSALFGLDHPDIANGSNSPAVVETSTSIRICANPGNFTTTQARLLYEAATVSHPKWRCLSLYRILENAYLSNIKETLMTEFDQDASKAIENAKKKVASELNQLVALAEKANLTSEFEAFNIEVDALLGAGNLYITKLDKGAEEESLYGAKEVYKKAVLRFYKLRCSIAHAGTSSVIYEQFQDANSAALSLLPSIEAIALKSLKIETIT